MLNTVVDISTSEFGKADFGEHVLCPSQRSSAYGSTVICLQKECGPRADTRATRRLENSSCAVEDRHGTLPISVNDLRDSRAGQRGTVGTTCSTRTIRTMSALSAARTESDHLCRQEHIDRVYRQKGKRHRATITWMIWFIAMWMIWFIALRKTPKRALISLSPLISRSGLAEKSTRLTRLIFWRGELSDLSGSRLTSPFGEISETSGVFRRFGSHSAQPLVSCARSSLLDDLQRISS